MIVSIGIRKNLDLVVYLSNLQNNSLKKLYESKTKQNKTRKLVDTVFKWAKVKSKGLGNVPRRNGSKALQKEARKKRRCEYYYS